MEWKLEDQSEWILQDGSNAAARIQYGIKEKNPVRKFWTRVLISNTYLSDKQFFRLETIGVNFLCFRRKFKSEQEQKNYIDYRKKELLSTLGKKASVKA